MSWWQLRGHQGPAAVLEASRHEPAAPAAARISRREDTCPICLGPLEDPAGMHPCWHAFCHACIQRWADTTMVATCSLCRQPILAIRCLQLEDNHAGAAHCHHSHLHPGVWPWPRQQGRQQQQQGPRGQQRRRLSPERGEHSPNMPRQCVYSRSPGQTSKGLAWLWRIQDDEPGSGDHALREFLWLRWLHF